MQNANFQSCDSCLSYLTGDGTSQERLQFERHLQNCPSCRQQMNEFQEVWDALPLQMEQVEVPIDLKAKVMDQITKLDENEQQDQPVAQKQEAGLQLVLDKKKRISWSFAIIAAAVLLFIAGTIWNVELYRDRTAGVEETENKPAAVEKVYSLNAASASTSGTGKACILKQGSERKLVVYLYGMTETRGQEAYQVWLIRDGKRTNAGTFHVSVNGLGILTYKMSENDKTFEAIGITLEPDSHGTQPRGKKVLGT